jgi:hypothetical protein
MLCSRKLFKANNDLAVLKKIQECKVPPPSSINPNVPKELDEIILKALSRDRTKRHENMDQLNRALIKFLYANYPEFNATDLQYFAKELFKEEIKKDREKLFEFGKIDLTEHLRDLKRENEGGTNQAAAAAAGGMSVDVPGSTRAKSREAELDFGFEEDSTQSRSRSRVSRRKSATPDKTSDAIDLDSKFGEGGAVSGENLKVEATTIGRIKRSDIGSKTTDTSGKKKRSKKGTSTHTRKVRLKTKKKKSSKAFIYAVALVAVLAFIGKDYIKEAKRDPAQVDKKTSVDQKPKEDQIWEKNEDAIVIIDNFNKQKHTLFVDGVKSKVNYLKEIIVPSGKEVTLRIQTYGKKHFVKKIVAEAGNEKSISVPEMENEAYAFLVTSRRCIMGKMEFEVYGERRNESLPIIGRISFPAPYGREPASETSYEITYQRVGEDLQRKVTVDFSKEEQVIDLCTKL